MRLRAVLPRTYLLAALAVGPILTPVVPLAAVAQQAPRRGRSSSTARRRSCPRLRSSNGSGEALGRDGVRFRGDGRRDRSSSSHAARQTETEGLKVPVIYESRPYYAGTSGDRGVPLGVKQEVGARRRRARRSHYAFKPDREKCPNSLVADWMPRGFAVVHRRRREPDCRKAASPSDRTPNTRAEGGHRLAQRPGEGIPDDRRKRRSRRDVVHRQGRDDRHFLQRNIPWRRRRPECRASKRSFRSPRTRPTTTITFNGLVRHPGGYPGEDIDYLFDYIHSGDTARRDHCKRN